MEEITSLVKTLKSSAQAIDHLKRLTFKKGETFGWSHTACAITYAPAAPHSDIYLLHEFGHALYNHKSYSSDVELLHIERKAWDAAQTLGKEYDIQIDEQIIEDAMDSYRDWLHSRSRCPACEATGVQVKPYEYACLACRTTWKVNEARTCALRRYKR